MTNYNDGKWHGWNGGECPVNDDSIVEGVYLLDGEPAPETPVTDRAAHFDWPYHAANTLIAFRVVKEYREPRDRWAYLTHMFDTEAKAEAFRAQLDANYPGRGYLDMPITHWREVVD